MARARLALLLGVLHAATLGVLAPAVRAQAPPCAPPGEWPAKLRLDYAVTASRGPFSISGESVLLFERSAGTYSIDVNTESALIYHAHQTSRGTRDAHGLRPDEYVETRTRRTTQTTTFDWQAQRVIFSVAPDAVAATQPGLQDRASLLLQLTWRHRADPAAKEYAIPVAGARRVSVDRFQVRGVEEVNVPLGVLQAVRVERLGNADDDRLEAWFSPAWCGLPVRIRYTDHKGGVIDHRLQAAKID
jgi:Protein of unknown function (DUF3108)